MLEKIFEQEQKILETINSIDSDKEELTEKYRGDIESIDLKKRKKWYELRHFYQMNIMILYDKAVEVVKDKQKEVELLRIHEYEKIGRDHYRFFFIFPENPSDIVKLPGTHDNYCKWQLSLDQSKKITIEELIYDEVTKNEHVKEIYYNLKKVIEKNGNN